MFIKIKFFVCGCTNSVTPIVCSWCIFWEIRIKCVILGVHTIELVYKKINIKKKHDVLISSVAIDIMLLLLCDVNQTFCNQLRVWNVYAFTNTYKENDGHVLTRFVGIIIAADSIK